MRPPHTHIRRNSSAIAALAVLLLVCSGAAAVAGHASTGSTVLYDQYNNGSIVGTNSQKYEAGLEALDDELADDFLVPAGEAWSVTTIDVDGSYQHYGGPATSFNVVFYTSGAGLPADENALETRPNMSFSQSGDDFTITLDPAVSLAAGTYWVSVQANQNTGDGEWYWTDRIVQSLQGAAWRNPGDVFGNHCTRFTPKTGCGLPVGGPDQVFKLSGTSMVPPPPCIVPNVVGKLLAKAKTKISKAHCKLGKVTKAASSVRKRGRVLAQRPRAGRHLLQGAKVNLVVGKGPRR